MVNPKSQKTKAIMPKNKTPFTAYIVLIIWSIVCIFPIYWMFTFSLKTNSDIFKNPVGLPKEWMWENYSVALKTGNLLVAFKNSILITVITIVITVICALMACYALTRMKWKGRNTVNNIFMLGLTIPIHAALLPVFLLFRDLKMLNSNWSLIIPYSAFALAMAIMIFSSFIGNVPVELEESACLDGCGTFGIFFKIVLPLMLPAISTVAIFTFLQAWNEFMFASIFISEKQYNTIPVAIQNMVGAYTVKWGPIGAGLALATAPTLLVYAFLSKKIQESLIAGAIKG